MVICVRFFIHGQDPGGGENDVIPLTPGKFFTLPTETFMIGSDNLLAPVCPVDVTTDGEYPWYCPTPLSIDTGAIAFSYNRVDIQPPVSILNDYLKTGVDPYTNSNKTGKPTPGNWPGPGYIISPSLFNPEIPIDDSHKYAFWDNKRVGNSWSADGDSWHRIDCGNGISIGELLLGTDNIPFNDAGPAVDPETDVIMQCSPPTVEWENYASKPKGWDENNYCPEETYADYQTYIEYNYNKVSTYMSSLTLTLDDCASPDTLGNLTGDFNHLFGQCAVLYAPQSLMCGIPPSKFDSVYIPSQKYKNWPKEREELAAEMLSFTTGDRETSVRPWHGVGFNEFGQHLVFYANYDDEDSVQEALGYANDFYEKSQLNGGSPIRIPVVIMNTDNMWLQDDDDDDNNKNGSQSPPFTCPSSSTTSTTTTSSSANTNSSVGVDDEDFPSSASFLVGSISNLLSSVFFAAVLYSC